MKKFIAIILLSLPLIINAATTTAPTNPATVTSQTAPVSNNDPVVAQQLVQILKKLNTMQANFTQTYYDNGGNVAQKSSGQMALQHPGKFRWQTTSPNNQLLLTNGTYVWLYNEDLKQASRTLLDPEQMTNPASLLSGDPDLLTQRFNVLPITNADGTTGFQLQPKKPNDLFQWIKLSFNDGTLTQMRMTDNLGHLSQIDFSSVQTGINLNSNLFNFSAPAGVDVIKQ